VSEVAVALAFVVGVVASGAGIALACGLADAVGGSDDVEPLHPHAKTKSVQNAIIFIGKNRRFSRLGAKAAAVPA
jgi:hypothetical protein